MSREKKKYFLINTYLKLNPNLCNLIENGELRIENGELKMESGELKMESGTIKV